ncbi:MAG: ATP-binding protein [Verrucomicrobiota bacterium]
MRALGGLAVCAGLFPAVLAERSSNWRMFKAVDGLAETDTASLTVSPRGNVWIKHPDAEQISVFDGYRIRTLPSPGRDSFRIYESRTGQLWSLYSGGLAVYSSDQWVHHPVAEIRAEIQSDPLRQLRQVPLLPAERDRVLFLLGDKLMEYDSSERRTVALKSVAETGLGRFSELSEARDGGLWLTGAKGIAKLPGPIRHLRPGTPCEEFPVPEGLWAENLQRPYEDAFGSITVAATDTRANGQRVLLRLDRGAWSRRSVESANIRQAWLGWDNVTWAYTVNSLLRFDGLPIPGVSREKLWAGQYKDVATETNGVFWLATSEGALRYAPALWRTPTELDEITSHVHAILEDDKNRLWFASSDSLYVLTEDHPRAIKWPDGLDGTFEATDRLYLLGNGQIVVRDADRAFLFDPDTDRFQLLQDADGRQVRLLGSFARGPLIVQIGALNDARGFELSSFDGSHFEPLAHSTPSWNLGHELLFATGLINGDIWIGSAKGIGRVRNGELETFGSAKGIRETRITCLTDMGGGRLWCGAGDRILEFNGKSWSSLRAGFDRISGVVRGPDEKTWVTSADGLFCYANGSWIRHAIEEGLPSIGVSEVYVDRRRQLWAATTRGISRYHSEADLEPPKTLPPVLAEGSGAVTGDRSAILLNAIDKWQNSAASRLLFATRLDEGAWSPFTNSMTKVFERMGAGKHRLDVRAMDCNWNEDPEFVSFDFSVVLAWYKDPRLIGSVFSAGMLTLFFAALAVNRHLRLIRSYAAVERIVALRTAELERANEELLQSQKMRALGTMAAGIAHDFNNILSIIKGSAQIIEDNLQDKQKILTRLNRIQAVVEQGSGIVKSILGLSRVKEKDLVKTEVNVVIEHAIRLLGDKFLHDITIQFRPSPELPAIQVARELIQQMMLNLILNAADAMEYRGQIAVTTGELHQLPPNLALSPARAVTYVYIAVQDTGCGIGPEILPRIFEPFFTTKALSARRGTGLGLSIVYELARQMGYGLEVRSALGKGSVFKIILPARSMKSEP